MTQEKWIAVDRYITDLFVPPDPLLDAALQASDAAGLSELVEIRVGKATETLSHLADEGCPPFDLIFIDADKPSNPDYLSWALKLSHRGSLIVADNVVRDGQVIEANSNDASVQGIRRFNEMLACEPRAIATAIQTVGSKGYDGFAIAVVTSDD
jgi:predicted O-methyltransferase YrrM